MSLFLQDGLQRNDGAIALHYATALPPGAEMPGKITAYDVSGAPLGVDTFAFPRAELIKTARLGPPIDPARGEVCELGLNLYSKEKPAAPPPGVAAQAAAAADAAAAAPRAPVRVDSVSAAREILEGSRTSQSTSDLNLLANLIGAGASGSTEFKLNLFPDTSMHGGGSGGGGAQVIVIDTGRDMAANNRSLVGIMDDMNLGDDLGVGGRDADEDDLLGLLDQAGR